MKIARNEAYNNSSSLRTLHEIVSRDQKRYFKKIVRLYARYNYYYKKRKTPFSVMMLAILTIKRNIMSPKRNIWLLGSFGDNLKICHANVVVARSARIGNNVVFHGNNCIGIKSDKDQRAPRIGDNVDVGYGAMIIGPVVIAEGVTIGAGAVVTKDCLEQGGIYVGCPARRIK